jgi:Tfp pilus assembly protein PilN
MRAVNLLPSKPGRGGAGGGSAGSRRPVAILAAVAVVAGIGYLAWSARSEVNALSTQVTQATDEKTALETQLASLLAVDQRASAQIARRGAVVTVASARINWERIVRDTVTVLPEKVWLTQVSGVMPTGGATTQTAAAAGQPTAVSTPPQGLHLEGFAFTQVQVAQLLARLEAVPGLGEPRLASAEKISRGGKRVVQFILDAPIDQRAQDRPTLSVVSGDGAGTAPATTAGGTPAQGGAFQP